MRFIGENLGAKGLKHFILFYFFVDFIFWLWDFTGYKEWIIQLD
jgi:hypothetical protein